MNKNYNIWLSLKGIFVFLALFFISFNLAAQEQLEQRFNESRSIRYNITFNGIPSGYIDWRYLGKDLIDGREVLAISIESSTDILRLLNLVSREEIYLDAHTNLPVKVKRDVELFGKKEVIEEIYDQKKGKVTIVRKKDKEEVVEEVYEQDVPIHNILELLYFFPKEISLKEKKGEWMEFNLPNQKVQIRFNSKRELDVDGQRKEAYFLEGKGARRFNLWLCQENRLPLRLDFLFLIGRVRIRKEKDYHSEAKL